MFLRSFGAGAFVRLRDRTGELQLYCQEPVLGAGFARLEDFDLGDFIEAEGETMATGADAGDFRLSSLDALVRMKLSAFRDKDRVHLRDLVSVGLIDDAWLPRLPETLRMRLEQILASPEG